VQLEWHASAAKHNIVAAGRRSYKTERAKRKLVTGTEHHPGLLTLPGGRFFAGGPTYGQAKRIYWKDLKDMTEPFWKGRPSESELVIRTIFDSELHVIGLDQPARIEGVQWHGGVLDEYGNMRPETWPEHVQPVTADTGAWVDFIGVPEGRNHYYDLVQATIGVPDWRFFTWKSADVLPAHVIEAARRVLDESAFLQEYEASFEQRKGLVYPSFSREGNVVWMPFDPRQPLHYLACDFNAGEKPMHWMLIMPGVLGYYATWELVKVNCDTLEACRHVRELFQRVGYRGRIEIVGDRYGKGRHVSASRSSYEIMRRELAAWLGPQPVIKHKEVLAVDDRVDAMRALVKSADGTRRFFIHEECTGTIEDFENVSYDSEGKLDGKNPKRTHGTDAASYFAYNYHPVHKRQATVVHR
jgi:hypothetical protein